MLLQNIDHRIIKKSVGFRDRAELLESRAEFLDGQNRVILSMSIKGATFRQIAALTGRHEATIARQVRRISLRLLEGDFVECLRKRHRLTKEQLAIAKDYYLARLSLCEIARKRHCTLYHVRNVISRLTELVGSPKPSGRKTA